VLELAVLNETQRIYEAPISAPAQSTYLKSTDPKKYDFSGLLAMS
jgi:hypothetical protein